MRTLTALSAWSVRTNWIGGVMGTITSKELRPIAPSDKSALLEELVPETAGDPKAAASVPVWFAHFIDFVDKCAAEQEYTRIASRLRAVMGKTVPTAQLMWAIKAAMLPPGDVKTACEQRAQGVRQNATPTNGEEAAAMCDAPESLTHMLAYSDGYVTRSADASEAAQRVASRRDAMSTKMKAALAVIEAWQS